MTGCQGRSPSIGHQAIFLNTLRPRQNGRHFADNPFKRIFLNDTLTIAIKISLNFVPKGPIENIPALVQIRAWRRRGDKPLSEPMMVSLLTHICVTQPQWVKIVDIILYLHQQQLYHLVLFRRQCNSLNQFVQHVKLQVKTRITLMQKSVIFMQI